MNTTTLNHQQGFFNGEIKKEERLSKVSEILLSLVNDLIYIDHGLKLINHNNFFLVIKNNDKIKPTKDYSTDMAELLDSLSEVIDSLKMDLKGEQIKEEENKPSEATEDIKE